MNSSFVDLGSITNVVDALIDNAKDYRSRNCLEYDSIITAEVSKILYDRMASWGAIDYLEIAYHIHVKIKES